MRSPKLNYKTSITIISISQSTQACFTFKYLLMDREKKKIDIG